SSSAAVAVFTLIRPAGFGMVLRLGLVGAFPAGGPRATIWWPTTHHPRPSLSILTDPSRSVRSRGIPSRASRLTGLLLDDEELEVHEEPLVPLLRPHLDEGERHPLADVQGEGAVDDPQVSPDEVGELHDVPRCRPGLPVLEKVLIAPLNRRSSPGDLGLVG